MQLSSLQGTSTTDIRSMRLASTKSDTWKTSPSFNHTSNGGWNGFEAGGLITGSSFHRGMCKKTVPLGDPKDGRVKRGIPKMFGGSQRWQGKMAGTFGKRLGNFWSRSYSIGYGKNGMPLMRDELEVSQAWGKKRLQIIPSCLGEICGIIRQYEIMIVIETLLPGSLT